MKQFLFGPRLVATVAVATLAFLLASGTASARGADFQPLAEKSAPQLPLSGTFARGTPGQNGGPYVLTLTNTSNQKLVVSGTIVWSVTSHNRANTIKLPARELGAGESWSIDDLAAEDRVILEADGYEKIEFTVPPKR